jgi:hypothetical protein
MYPGNWRGTSYAFVLHWREQISQYEKLELENVPPKQRLRMFQNTVSDVTDLSHVKQLSDQVVARGEPALGFDEYLELLLSACSTMTQIMSLLDLVNAMCMLRLTHLSSSLEKLKMMKLIVRSSWKRIRES